MLGRNAARKDFQRHFKIHPVLQVSHTGTYEKEFKSIARPIPESPSPVPAVEGNEQVVKKIFVHSCKGKNLTSMEEDPFHDTDWQPLFDFIDRDESVTANWYKCIQDHNIHPQYH